MAGEVSVNRLRTRYLDWCAAKVAERFLHLSPEEVWQRAARVLQPPDPGTDGERGLRLAPGSVELARLLSSEIARELALPPFDEWVEAYRGDPARFDEEVVRVGTEPR